MTTIAWKDGILACDSRETSYKSQIDTDRSKKIWRLSNGSLFGGAGSAASIQVLLTALKNAVKASKSSDKALFLPSVNAKGAIALLVEDKTHAWFFEKGVWMPCNYPYAIGSGQAYAQAALDAGLSAPEAVKIAIGRDCFSGGRIQILKWRKS